MPESSLQSRHERNQPEVELLLSCTRTSITPEISNRIRSLVEEVWTGLRLSG